MSTYKRKRSADAQALMVYRPFKSPYKKPYKPSRKFVPGADRVGGYYGRYSGRGGELKFHDVDLDDGVVAAGGNVTATVNIIAQGVTESQRVGRKCTIKSIHWRYRIFMPAQTDVATSAAGDNLRVIMYLDKQANGATAAATDILETADYQSFRNLANSQRFNIILDRTSAVNYDTMTSEGAGVVSTTFSSRDFVLNKKCNIPIEFSATTGAIGEIRSNNIGVMLVGNAGIAGFDSKIRLRFSDV